MAGVRRTEGTVGKRKLKQYSGTLTPEQAALGMTVAQANARRLLQDARLLFEAARYPSALALSVLSIEEAGKVSILRGLAVEADDARRKQGWRDYRTHTRKNAAWIVPELASKGARTLEDLRPAFDDSADHPSILDTLKQVALYSDCVGDGRWTNPVENIDKDFCEHILRIAEVLAVDKGTSPREMELWVEHVGPVWRRPFAEMKKAVLAWYTSMQAEGLAAPDERGMARFLDERVDGSGA
jgi:AbiV family abortive infection protein